MLNKISIALLAAASVVSLCMLPRTGTDAAKLLPAQVLVIAQEDGRITVESDNGASGSGTTLPDALAAMREGAEGTLFLDTAEHIILLQSTQSASARSSAAAGSSVRRQSCIWRGWMHWMQTAAWNFCRRTPVR